MDLVDIVGWLAAAFTLATFSMKTMIPLRITAILSNITFVAYAILSGIYPIATLHCLLLPFNLFRLMQIGGYFSKLRESYSGDFSLEWIRSLMFERTFKTGSIIFRKGDQADYFYFLAKGRVRFPEISRSIGPGEIFGEIAFFAPSHGRTTTAICEEPVTVYCLDEPAFRQVYFQNPLFGFYVIEQIAGRLSENVARLERRGIRTTADLHPVSTSRFESRGTNIASFRNGVAWPRERRKV